MLTRYGTDVLIAVAIAVVILLALGLWSGEQWVRAALLVVALALTGFSLNFFRDPDRTPATGGKALTDLVISPADGTVVLVKQVDEESYLHEKATMLSIFMSPLDVHVNRIPVGGTVEYLQHIDGTFRVASSELAASRNERQSIGIKTDDGHKLIFNQVTGYVARRIVCELHEGVRVKTGDRFGMIKFGSRVDLYLPVGTHVLVKEGDRTRGGETPIARWESLENNS